MNPLLDSNFLIKLNNDKNRTIYAHVISLNQYEHPIEQIEGVVTAGSVTIDGQSAVRRVCSLTLSAKNLNINNVYWGLTTKVKIEIGLQNNVEPKYDKIIWFPQGVFILTDFKTTQTVNNYTINLTGKDKGCLLNGDVSGNFPAPIRFDSYTDSSNQAYEIGVTGEYNNYLDINAQEAILAGFTERYGSDYQYIQGQKKILSLTYIPYDGNKNLDAKIKFNQGDSEWTNLNSLLSSNPIIQHGKNTYDVNIGENDVYGFLVTDCSPGDRFEWTIEQKIPIAIIIQEMLHQFGQERYSNIIIRDINPYALEMLDSVYKDKHYLLHDGDIYTNFITQAELINNYQLVELDKNENYEIKTDEDGNITNILFKNYIDEDDISLIDILNNSSILQKDKIPTKIMKKGAPLINYTVTEINPNTVAGYGMTLLVYPDELIAQPGDSITSILDKIVNMMGDYEYFYDLNGQFIFQAKPSYIKTAWNGTITFTEENYIEASELSKRVAYTFDDSALATQYQNTPNMNNIKNDYIIWGERKNLSGNAIKFHGRYAIDNIPYEYTDFNGFTWSCNRRKALIQAIQEKIKKTDYKHTYIYPTGYMPEETGWWEINDWANYYQTVFGIDLKTNGTMMQNYSQDKGLIADAIEDGKYSIFQEAFQYDRSKVYNTGDTITTDVVSIIYTDTTKTKIQGVIGHGTCTYYYCQFMDLRTLDEGWDYQKSNGDDNELFRMYPIVHTWDSTRRYKLENNTYVTTGYHPDYTTSFIYRPILPTEIDDYSNEIISNVIQANGVNLNGQKRQFALTEDVDWRHLIHIMADDWYAHHTEDDYEINIRKNNSWPNLNIDLFPYGRTGYEQYYLDFTSVGGFWQDLYNINFIKYKYFLTNPTVRDDSWSFLQSQFDKEYCKMKKFGSTDTSKNINIQSIEKTEFSSYYIINISIPIEQDKNILIDELKYLDDYILEKEWETNKEDEIESYLLICKVSKKILADNIIDKSNISIIVDIINNNLSVSSYKVDPGELYAIITIFNNNKQFFNGGQYKYWNRDVVENPEKLIFWFDFFRADEMGIGKFATSVIGDRPKTINDSAIKTIIYRDTPDVIYCSWDEYCYYKKMLVLKDGYKYFILNNSGIGYLAEDIDLLFQYYQGFVKAQEDKNEVLMNYYLNYILEAGYTEESIKEFYDSFSSDVKQNFVRTIRGKTVHDQADNMLYQYSYYNDTVNLNSVPIYYLQPNTIISTKDELSKVTGYYVINKINISLAYNGTMSITAIKSPERIY